jgi:ABC-type transport system substrate-binding protein
VTQAKQLLTAAGIDSLKGELEYTQHLSAWPFNDTKVTLVTDALREIGLDYSLKPYDYSGTLVNLANKEFDIYMTPQYANGVDPNEYLSFYFLPDSVRNYGAWEHPGIVPLYEKQDQTVDPQERNAILKEIVELLEIENPRAPTMANVTNHAVRKWLHNYYVTPVSWQFRPAVLWRDRA